MNAPSRSEEVARRIVSGSALAGAAAAVVAILLRVLDQWYPWASAIKSHFGMALHTSVLLLLLNAALYLHIRRPAHRAAGIAASGLAGGVAVVALLLLVRRWWPVPFPFEQWLAALLLPDLDGPVGHMSPHTALTFLSTAAALVVLAHCRGETWLRRQVAFGLAAAGVASGAAALMSHAILAPLLFGPVFTSLKWVGASLFVLLNANLMLAAYPRNWLLEGLLNDAGDAAGVQGMKYRRVSALIFLLVTLSVALAGVYFLRVEQASLRSRKEQDLAVVADLKVAQIAEWRATRLREAELVRYTPYASRRAFAVLQQPKSAMTQKIFTDWLELFREAGSYTEVVLLDDRLQPRLGHPAGATLALSEPERAAVAAAQAQRRVVMTDLHRSEPGAGAVRLSLAVPLVDRTQATNQEVSLTNRPPEADDLNVGTLVLRVDASQTLFPLVKRWATTSPSAEMFLVRRGEREGWYLSELRFQTNAALELTFPITDVPNPVVPGSLIGEQVARGRDYRDVPVLAVARSVPDAPWHLVAKVDEDEIYAPVWERARALSVTLAALLLGGALGLNLIWRRRENELLRWQLATEHQRLALAQRLAHLMDHANDIIATTDGQWRILEMNRRGLQQYGYTLAELRQMRAMDLRSPAGRADFPALAEVFAREGSAVVETIHQRKDGSTFPVEVSIRRVDIGGTPHTLAVIRDITARKQAEQALRDSESRYRSLVETAQDAIFTTTPEGVFTSLNPAFETLTGWPREAWIGKDFGDLMHPEDLALARDMAARVAGGERTPAFEVRVRMQGGDFIVVQVLAAPQVRDGKVEALLGIARDVTVNKLMEDALRSQEARLRMALEVSNTVTWEWDTRAATIRYSANASALARGPEIAPYCAVENLLEAIHPEDREQVRGAIHRTLTENAPFQCEYRVRMLDGQYRWILGKGKAVLTEHGKPLRVLGTSMDITERRQIEQKIRDLNESLEGRVRERTAALEAANAALQESEAQLRLALTASKAGAWSWDVKSGVARWDERFHALYGFGPQETISHEAWLGRIHPEDRPRLEDRIRVLVAPGGGDVWNEEFRVLHPTLGLRWMAGLGRVERDAAGRAVRFAGINLDVTERKQAEMALRESEERYRLLAETARDTIFALDRQGRLTYVNSHGARLFDVPVEQLVGKRLEELFPPEIARRQHLNVEKVCASGEPIYVEAESRFPGGNLWLGTQLSPMLDSAGRIVGVLGVARDITERRRTEEALRASEARNRLLSERTFEGIVIHEHGRIIDCNQSFAHLFGCEPAELLGTDGLQLVPPEERARVRAQIQAEATGPYETVGLRKDGSTFPMEVNARMMTIGERKIRFGSCRDITERKRAENEIRRLNASLEQRVRERTAQLAAVNEQLRASELQLKQAARAGNVGLWDWDLATNRVFFSTEWKRQIGYEDAEISDELQEWQSRLHPDDREATLEKVRAFLQGHRDKFEAEYRLRHKDGTYRWILAQGSILGGTEDKALHVLGSHVDITELKRLQEQLLEVSDREQARIGQDLHDGLSQLLVSAAFDLSRLEKRAGRSPKLAALARQAGETIDAALTQARGVARGLFAVQLGGDGLAHALRDLAANVSARHPIACEVRCPRMVPVTDDLAAMHLFRIAQEAVNNAVKHAKPRRMDISVTVKGGRIQLTVTDDGSGLAPARHSRSGMGLHIMDYRARALNGTFKIESLNPSGTRVSCSVPTREG